MRYKIAHKSAHSSLGSTDLILVELAHTPGPALLGEARRARRPAVRLEGRVAELLERGAMHPNFFCRLEPRKLHHDEQGSRPGSDLDQVEDSHDPAARELRARVRFVAEPGFLTRRSACQASSETPA